MLRLLKISFRGQKNLSQVDTWTITNWIVFSLETSHHCPTVRTHCDACLPRLPSSLHLIYTLYAECECVFDSSDNLQKLHESTKQTINIIVALKTHGSESWLIQAGYTEAGRLAYRAETVFVNLRGDNVLKNRWSLETCPQKQAVGILWFFY